MQWTLLPLHLRNKIDLKKNATVKSTLCPKIVGQTW